MNKTDMQTKRNIWMRTYKASSLTSLFAMTTVAIIEVMMITLSIVNKPMYGPYLWRYRAFYISLLSMVLCYMAISYYIKRDFAKRFVILNIINPLAAIFFFAWSIGITYHDFLLYGAVDPTVFMTFALSVPSCFYLLPVVYGVIAVVADFMMLWVAMQAPNGMALAINLIIYFMFQMVLGLSMLQVKKVLSAEILKTEEQRDEIERLSSAQSLFFSSVSHEIRTPINAVLGMDDMILRESKEDNTLEYAENIRTAGNTLLGLINDILDFSKLGAGKMEIVPAEYETAALFHDLVVMIEARAKEKGLSIITKMDESIPQVLYGDDVRIKQVITNLLTNSVKYTEKGSVTLEARSERADDEHIDLFVSIKDTGIGIREEDLEKLFSAFERIDVRRNRTVEGTGLGMSITTNLLDLMGSRLEVSSEYEKGSDFHFVLRQKVVSWEPVGDYNARWKESVQKQKMYEVKLVAPEARTLVIDDNAMNRKVAAKLLGLFQIEPVLCESGAGAIEMVKQTAFDIVFLDHQMPEMDGPETLKRMRDENLISDTTKVIALTATTGENIRDSYLSMGFDDYLSKPIKTESLEAILRKWL